MKKGLLLNLTEILTKVSDYIPIDANGENNYTYYYSPIFENSKIIDDVPTVILAENEYILFELTIPSEEFIKNINLIILTPYFLTYDSNKVFASVDKSIEYFKPKPKVGEKIKVIFTSSKKIGKKFEYLGYQVSKIPAEFLSKSTFNILLRLGNLAGTYNPGELIKYSNISVNKSCICDKYLDPYSSLDIISSFPIPLNSLLFYNGNIKLLNSLLDLYSNTKQQYINSGNVEIPTYLYLQNLPNPPVDYAFQSFYDSITVYPPIDILANNTGEAYFNSEVIDLNNYVNKQIIILAVNQEKYGFALCSNIQIYNQENLTLIENGAYSTSIQIPPIITPDYPYVNSSNNQENSEKYPLVNIKSYDVNSLLNQNINAISIGERVSYNPINFNHSENTLIPRFSVFISN